MAGRTIAYCRVSTRDQNPEMQLNALKKHGYDLLFDEAESGRKRDRPKWRACLDALEPGDTLVFWKADRFGRSAADVLTTVTELRERGVRVVSLTESFDLDTPQGRFMFTVLAAAAEFENELRAERQAEGIAAARRREAEGRMLPGKKRIGRPHAIGPAELAALRRMVDEGVSVTEAARTLKIGRSTAYAALAATLPHEPSQQEAVQPEVERPEVEQAEAVQGETERGETERGETERGERGAVPACDDRPLTRAAADDTGRQGRDEREEREREEQERRWRRALKPIPAGIAGAEGYQGATWPDGWNRYHVATAGGERIGYAEQDGGVRSRGWRARSRDALHLRAGLPTRARAVAELVRRHRERTPATDAAAPGLPAGWRLLQTLYERDRHRYRLVDPGGRTAGTVERHDLAGQRHWRATSGDPAGRPELRWPLTPYGDDPDALADEGAWRTRAAAVRALAEDHAPDLDLATP